MEEQKFFIEVTRNGGRAQLLRVHGELDLLTASRLVEAIEALDGSGVVIDLSDCSFIDSTGLHALLTCATTQRTKIACPSGTVRRTFEIVVDAKRFMPIYDSLGQAVAAPPTTTKTPEAEGATGEANGVASQVQEQVQEKSSDSKGQAAERVRARFDTRSTQVVEQLGSIVQALRDRAFLERRNTTPGLLIGRRGSRKEEA